jgi:hypothetical protein
MSLKLIYELSREKILAIVSNYAFHYDQLIFYKNMILEKIVS